MDNEQDSGLKKLSNLFLLAFFKGRSLETLNYKEMISEKDKLEARKLADQLGLSNLPDSDLIMLFNAANVANIRRGSLDVESLSPGDEPAHVFVLPATR